jgi:hypothetical protein
MPTGWRRRGLAQWEKVRPDIRARGLPDLAVAALAKLPPLSTLTGAANGRLRPASWPPVDMVLATEGLEFHMGQRGHIAAGQRRMAGGSGRRGGCRCPRWGMGGHGQRAAEGTAAKGSPGSTTRVATGRERLATFKAGKEALRTPEVPHDRPNRGVFSWSGSPWRMCITRGYGAGRDDRCYSSHESVLRQAIAVRPVGSRVHEGGNPPFASFAGL